MGNIQTSPKRTGGDFCVPKKAKAPVADTGALKEVEKQRNYTSSAKTLRPYQSEAVDAVFKALDKGLVRRVGL